uniref:DNA-directed RNA polymerase subunit beta n=1 Tax=Trebouxia aggregata TaxID=160068 RepID=G8XPB7_9CHLO|nr:beta subunit of RNA polymerase [Trebouxia aggregata]
MRFHEHLVYSFIPDSVEIQRNSFYTLLKKGFIKELANRNPITNETHDLELFFYPQYYQLNRPECTPTEAILKSKSYSCKLYVPVQLTNRQSNEIKLQWVLLGNLPLMTKRGHFIINGSPRVVINQLVRSPGIYYQERIDIKKRKTYYADLISYRGTWLRLEIDKKRRVWARMKKIPKISALVFLQALGFTRNQMKFGIRFFDFLNESRLKENHPTTTEEALISLYEKSQINLSKTLAKKEDEEKPQVGDISPIMGQKFLFRKFMNPRTYNLGLVGRMRLNKKFGISEKDFTLTRLDIFCAINYLINLKFGITSVDDIDNLKNRRVKASGELIQNQLNTGLIRLEKTIREKMKTVKKGHPFSIQNLITTKPINGALREFFGSSPLSQYLDQTNPLAEITHKRRLSSLGPGGLSRETAGMAVRSIHPTHYGRICPIETPEGRNAGLVNSMTIHARINSHGFLKTPFYNVYQGQIQKQDSSLRDARPLYFSAEQEELVKVAPGDLKASKLNFLSTSKIPIRIEKDYYRVSREQVEYIAMSPIQMISIATSLIPFLEHDDANRALMGSNMQRQAVPIMLPERPIVGTGLEARAAGDSGYVVQSKMGGCVSYASGKKIVILEKSTKVRNIFTISNKFTSLGSCLLKSKSSMLLKSPISDTTSFYPMLLKSSLCPLSSILTSIAEHTSPIFVSLEAFATHRKQAYSILRKKEHNGDYKENHTAYPLYPLYLLKKKRATFKNDAFVKQEGNMNLNSCKENSLINLIFVSLIQSTDFTTNFSTMLLKEKTKKRRLVKIEDKGHKEDFNKRYEQKLKSSIKGHNKRYEPLLLKSSIFVSLQEKYTFKISDFNKLGSLKSKIRDTKKILKNILKAQDTTSKRIKAASFYSISLKNSSIRSLRSLYKKNQSTFSTNLPKPIRIQNYRNKLYLLITSDIWALKSKIYKSKVKDNLQFQLQNRVSKTLSSKKRLQGTQKSKILMKLAFKIFFKISDFNEPLLLKSSMKGHKASPVKIEDKASRDTKIEEVCSAMLLEDKGHKEDFKEDFRSIGHNKRYEQQLKYSIKGYKQQRDKSLLNSKNLKAKKKMDTQLKQEKSKNRLFWAAISDKNLDQTPNKNEEIPKNQHPLLDSLSEVFDNPSEQEVKGYEILMSNLAKNDKTNLKQKLLTSFRGAERIRAALFPPKGEVGSDINENLNNKIKPIEYSLQNYQRSNQETCLTQRPTVKEGEWVQQGDLLADCTSSVSGDLSLGKNILVAYMPWEGYNFEDAILISERLVYDDIYTSLHIVRYEVEIRDTKFGVEQISSQLPDIPIWELSHLDEKGIAKVGCWVKEGDILIGKVTPIKKKSLSPHEKLLYDIVGKKIPTTRNTSLRLPKGVEGRVTSVEILETENIPPGISFAGPGRVHVFIAEKRKIQVGDKISGRHGNKGIVSKIIPQQDMPYLPNGTPVDMVLNPLGVPSRMNVGQVFEALLGLAGVYLNQSFKIPSFDETYGPEASRSIVYSKLYEARLKSGQKWLFDPNFPGKTRVFDGRTGQCFEQLVTVGQAYMLKLVHQVDDKIHARSTGPYSLVTQQPLRGRAKHGGQRLGEMEVWALEGFGAAYTLQELLTIKSDDTQGRHKVINSIFTNTPITIGTPEAFKVLIGELQSLCLDPVIYVKTADSTKPARPIINVVNWVIRKRKKVVKIQKKVDGSTV